MKKAGVWVVSIDRPLMIRSEHMKSCITAQIRFLLFKGPGSFKKFFIIGGNIILAPGIKLPQRLWAGIGSINARKEPHPVRYSASDSSRARVHGEYFYFYDWRQLWWFHDSAPYNPTHAGGDDEQLALESPECVVAHTAMEQLLARKTMFFLLSWKR